MIAAVDEVILKNGERMVVKVIEPPQKDYAERLCQFLEHKDNSNFRGIKQRLEARYVDYCIDKYFVGEINNRIVGQVWYGLPKGRTGIGNFGHVYTEPLYRGKGIGTELVKTSTDDFVQGNGTCLLCSAGEMVAKIYQRFGFRFIRDNAKCGPMALIKKGVAKDFQELDDRYFEPGLEVKVREGNIGDRHDCDRMLDFSSGLNEIKESWHRVFIASQVPTFMDALYHVEDGNGMVTVIESSKGNILGYAFILNLGSESERYFKVMDFVIHPNYFGRAVHFIKETGKIARASGIAEVHAFSASCDKKKVAVLVRAGFKEEHRFARKFRINERNLDVVALRLEPRG